MVGDETNRGSLVPVPDGNSGDQGQGPISSLLKVKCSVKTCNVQFVHQGKKSGAEVLAVSVGNQNFVQPTQPTMK